MQVVCWQGGDPAVSTEGLELAGTQSGVSHCGVMKPGVDSPAPVPRGLRSLISDGPVGLQSLAWKQWSDAESGLGAASGREGAAQMDRIAL